MLHAIVLYRLDVLSVINGQGRKSSSMVWGEKLRAVTTSGRENGSDPAETDETSSGSNGSSSRRSSNKLHFIRIVHHFDNKVMTAIDTMTLKSGSKPRPTNMCGLVCTGN